MGKWQKAPPQVSEQFLQNEQRRKQMIIQAAKRRREKEKKLQEQIGLEKKQQEDALIRHKQDKKDVYIKYLRNNMHDKYEEIKRNQKGSQPQVRSNNKWKKDNTDSAIQLKNQNDLQSLNLQVNLQSKKRNIQARTYSQTGGQVVRNLNQKNSNQQPHILKYHNSQKQHLNDKFAHKEPQIRGKNSQKRRMLQNQFEDMWKQDHQEEEQKDNDVQYELSAQESIFDDLIGSKLLDSLDLDFGTVSRGKRLDKKLKKEVNKQKQSNQNKQINQIKNMIGYESILMSVDERSEMMKKYNEFMKNQVQKPNIKIEEENVKKKENAKQKNVKGAKNIKEEAKIEQKPLNQRQYFNELKNKKQGKILNWANSQEQEADDLFSNCSTNKKSKTRGFEMLKEINKDIQTHPFKKPPNSNPNIPSKKQIDMKKKEKPLESIPQKVINLSREKLRQRSYQKKNQPNDQKQTAHLALMNPNKSHQIKRSASKQKIVEVSKTRAGRVNSAEINQAQNNRMKGQNSRQKASKTATNSFKYNKDLHLQNRATETRTRTDSRRSLSRQKQNNKTTQKQMVNQDINQNRNVPIKPPLKNQTIISPRQTQSGNSYAKILHLPQNVFQKPPKYPYGDQITIATQDQRFQVQSFIKNELISLNKQERQLQQELKNIHIQNKQKIKQVQKKYDIKTDYKRSYQLKENQTEQEIQQELQSNTPSYNNIYKKQNEDELEESIQRLDDMLLRKEILEKQKHSRITEQDNESSSTSRSLINPMCDPIQLHKQVLQLAENLSRFDGEPENIEYGYGAKLRMKNKSTSKQKNISMKKIIENNQKQTEIDLSQSQDVNFSQLNSAKPSSKVSKPPQLDYLRNKYAASIPNTSDLLDDQLQDSIQKGKIEVNEKLKKMLLE